MAAGKGDIMMPPVSVCHQVSTIGHFSLPITLAVPTSTLGIDRLTHRAERRSDDRSCFSDVVITPAMKARIAVGAV
jgi:hypothetical protein